MRGADIRRAFLSFFEKRGHTVAPSSSLIPNDPSLLLTTAGMVQFKPYFLGQQEPPYPRAATVQKSFRTTDIENVGRTIRHMTFFEMLGNFSFGDYFKRVAIPCGPSSEISVDRGPEHGPEGGPAVDEERFLEIWNLVFMQFERDDDFNLLGELASKGVDTGSGLERVSIVLQDVPSLFETDLLAPILDAAQGATGKTYGRDERDDLSLRILTEHGRAVTFLIADGVVPSNEGRGYVLRRMLRRVVLHARRLGVEGPVIGRLIERTVEVLGGAWPELVERKAFMLQVAASEEEHFV